MSASTLPAAIAASLGFSTGPGQGVAYRQINCELLAYRGHDNIKLRLCQVKRGAHTSHIASAAAVGADVPDVLNRIRAKDAADGPPEKIFTEAEAQAYRTGVPLSQIEPAAAAAAQPDRSMMHVHSSSAKKASRQHR